MQTLKNKKRFDNLRNYFGLFLRVLYLCEIERVIVSGYKDACHQKVILLVQVILAQVLNNFKTANLKRQNVNVIFTSYYPTVMDAIARSVDIVEHVIIEQHYENRDKLFFGWV